MAEEWNRRIVAADRRILAGELYQGRAFKEAIRAARIAETPLAVVSAGLGLVSEENHIPAYSLTVADHDPDAVSRKVNEGSFELPSWWRRLGGSGGTRNMLAELVHRSPTTLFVLALAPAYLELVADDLRSLAPIDLERIRLVGPRNNIDVPEGLREVHLPYDDRLDGVGSPIRGTESDFPQRAAFHFVQMVRNRAFQTPEEHKRLVVNALKNWPRKKVLVRQKLPEKDLRRVIKSVLRECNGHWSRALRRLRDRRKVACEQKRFKRICDEILQGTN